ncbi:hypothetical protein JW911_00135 [Candidatus Peregrinibacteria bacterium]|nr:hypothetical protein [Candidatus Peregrinibacteria bacterium]
MPIAEHNCCYNLRIETQESRHVQQPAENTSPQAQDASKKLQEATREKIKLDLGGGPCGWGGC